MIRAVKITNFRGETLTLDLANPWDSGLAVTAIKGLGPNKATINQVEVATDDGATYNSARVSSRNIVFTIRFVGTDIEACRQKTYKYFALKKPVDIEVITDKRDLRISGYTESNEPNIFSNAEDTSISVVCPYPFFYSVSESNTVTFYGEEPSFEFPFENEGEEPVLEFGIVFAVTEANVYYEGDYEVGVIITIHATGPAKNISIFKLDTTESIQINTDMETGDDIIISTVSRDKYIHRVRNGVTTNILNCIGKKANWFLLQGGDNAFAYTAEEGIRNLQFSVRNDVLYEGI